jgi:effector-binding domain-containing protein
VGIIKSDTFCESECIDVELLVETNSNLQKNDTLTVSEGNYCCIYSRGNFWDRKEAIEKLLKYIGDNNYYMDGDIIQKVIVDYTITDDIGERVYEFQMKVHK